MIMNIYRNIDRTQVQFDFVIHSGRIDAPLAREACEMGAMIYYCPAYGVSTARKYSMWWDNFFTDHPEYRIVHAHVRSTAAIVLKIAKQHGCKTVVHSHNTSSGTGIRAVVKNLLQRRIRYVADYFMGCADAAGAWLFGEKICQTDRYATIKNAIDTDRYIYDSHIAVETRSSLGFEEDDIVIGHVGRFAEPKNHRFLIEIFRELNRQNGKYKLLLVGDGELRNDIEQKVKEYGLGEAVVFTGVRSDVNKLLMAMDLFLFPSLWEGLPVSIVEAQASGLPCVISTAISNEVCITPLVTQVPLEEDINQWVSCVEQKAKTPRADMKKAIVDAGYDIHETVMWMTDFYKKLYNI